MVHIAEEEMKDEKKEGTEEKIECPTCGAKVAKDATECPECGEKLGEEEKEETEEEEEEIEEEDEEIEEEDEAKPSSSTFYAGIVVFLIGIAIAFGTWLHYQAKIQITGNDDFTRFGPSETAVAIVGVIIFLIGFGIIAVSMRKPAAESDEEEETEEEEEPAEDEEDKEEEKEEEETEDDEETEEEDEEEEKKKK